ncbi:potassium-transporting ATPase subunit KdpA [Conexibacter woesei]|uniref:Potassium-transporting ATPase potassium-binding subunit n=1 Tax=Conexibacter woesei (strain DSM 14684 / CCUG 47730 / CIP 108061 / JCM 11494 / NBRC 100937 / ID131577) TaxID=469383 RepID=D3F9I8_CONWI|nr:potassium-transporting ATPase subunit KdpA [Conexibacter woesei]ADB49155.1 potassium-transporting ATPase, A subunit [Conexibacter woesei DSM 14684]
MTAEGWIQILVFFAVLTALTPLIGAYMHKVFRGDAILAPVLGPVERGFYKLLRVDPRQEQDWKAYARAVLFFSLGSWLLLYAILRLQGSLPFNPAGFGAAPADVNFNTASSFVANTNWQYYAGETTLSNFSQMGGLAVQNFLSAAVGIAVVIAVIRGFSARSLRTLGNFWSDLTRTLLYILLPISFVGALFLVSQGVVQSLSPAEAFTSLEGVRQAITLGPVASQEVIKLLGTNGGGFFNVNSAMPFENSSGLVNFFEMLLILIIPAGLTATFGRMVGNRRQGWAIYGAMFAMFAVAVAIVYAAEGHGSPAQHLAGIEGGNFEGKETRFGIPSSALFAAVTTVASCGAVNAAMESLTGIGGAVPMANMMTGEVIFGGVGSGLYGMLMFVILAVFIAGLMVGRTPEFLGKKIGAREIKLTMIGTLAVPLFVLVLTAAAISSKYGLRSIYNGGPQGFSETLYAYVSQTNNNGSAFAGYTGFVQPNGPGNSGAFGITFADLLGGGAMLAGRFLPLLAVLAIAGALAGRKVAPAGPGTMRTDTGTFTVLTVGTVLLVALLTFVPALLLGPVVQGLTDRMF